MAKKKTATKVPAKTRPNTTKKASATKATSKSKGFGKKKADAGKGWKTHRGKEHGGGDFDNLPLESGTHHARLTSVTEARYKGGTKKGRLYGKFQYAMLFGDAKGEICSINMDLEGDMEKVLFQRSGTDVCQYDLVDEMLQNHGIDTSGLEWKELPDAFATITSEKPYVELYFQNKVHSGEMNGRRKVYGSCDEFGAKDDGYVQNIRANGWLTREEMETVAKEYGEKLPAK